MDTLSSPRQAPAIGSWRSPRPEVGESLGVPNRPAKLFRVGHPDSLGGRRLLNIARAVGDPGSEPDACSTNRPEKLGTDTFAFTSATSQPSTKAGRTIAANPKSICQTSPRLAFGTDSFPLVQGASDWIAPSVPALPPTSSPNTTLRLSVACRN